MSAAMSTAGPGRPARVPARAVVLVLTVLALLVAPLAAAPAEASAPPPAATSSCEPGELHQDAPEAALRLPTGHATRLPTAPRPRLPRPAAAHDPCTTAHAARPFHRALRTVVLRC
ncbi:hypothetical protein ACIREE_18165 [Streptomyces sp. NPDC102467]|uniref:hypothetical protein n=1 Tax=Streptomyces sp. NPDC102467 TaxID=3366179 RepID=UPI00382AC660